MPTQDADSNRLFWQKAARQISRRVNLGWWLDGLAAPLLVAGIAGAAVLLVARRQFPESSWLVLAGYTGAGIAVIGIAAWFRSTRKFESPAQTLVRIEAAMSLRSGLSAASAGVTPWPAAVKKADAGLSWHWPRLVIPPLGAIVLLAAGLFIPIPANTVDPGAPAAQPQAWNRLESQLDLLADEKVVDEKYLEETRKRLDELKAQEEDQWFSHSSLEATDSLQKSHAAEADRVERELNRAEKALDQLQQNAAGQTAEERAKQLGEFDQAMKDLQSGAMKPNPELLEQMKQIDPKNLDAGQMQQLKENLKKNAEAMKKAAGQGGEDWSDELLAGDGDQQGEGGKGDGEGEGDSDGGDKQGTGKGGVSRGPGHDPGVLGKEKDGLEIGDLTGLEAKDLSRALPGDLLQLQDGEHEVDKGPSVLTGGGESKSSGSGGDRVWKESLDPDEQRTLKRFFE